MPSQMEKEREFYLRARARQAMKHRRRRDVIDKVIRTSFGVLITLWIIVILYVTFTRSY